jgi:hypothetical protein
MTLDTSLKFAVLAASLLLTGCPEDDEDAPPKDSATFVYDLDTGARGWEAGFADYPAADVAMYELEAEWRALPAPLAGRNGIFVSGNNHSDDLFMYIKRRLSGLKPNTRYEVSFGVEFATNADSGCVGVGGAPGEHVSVKVGATEDEPEANTAGGGMIRMNIDHGNQSADGSDAVVIGNIANTQTDCTNDLYELKTLDNEDSPFEVFTGADGTLWALFATDSGFEGTTGIYFTRLEIIAEEI